ncbi:phospholipase D family protein [Ramlibacter sp. XY19]|uniref:phospholipase D family protein n=1 Tax=Ramlibacter paludis TaxID=2908000 RepID=UPI0023DAE7CB|nr:phospholipase D family protein [Ramlibacter paludis]MCG2591620.1 phospholipase D family protein [Ramlibacter paludis]
MRTPAASPAAPASHPSSRGWWRWLAAAVLLSWASGCASLPANINRTNTTAFAQPDQTPLGQLVLARRAQAAVKSDSAFHVMENVDIALASRIALIERATRSLDLQYYAIHADASTEVLLQGIRDAARRGVRVRILLDDFNSVGEDAQVLRLAFLPNVEMRLFNPVPGSRDNMVGRIVTSLHDFGRMQKRMHNKMFIADNAWGITGGRNLGDAYFGTSDKQNFVDLDVLAAGRIVRDMSASFDRFWNDELAYPVQTLLDEKELAALRKPDAAASAAQVPGGPGPAPTLPVTASPTVLPAVSVAAAANADRPALDLRSVPLYWAPATLLVDQPGKVGPGDDEVDAGETVIDGLLSLMQAAQRDVLIVSPYFVPGEQMMGVYRQLRQRNVRIRVLTNSLASNDAPAAHAGYARYRDALLKMGVEVYEMRSDPAAVANLIGSHGGGSSSGRSEKEVGTGIGIGSAAGGSKSGTQSRASLHSKAVFIDGRLAVIGSMNLDLRSKLKNSEVGLVIRSAPLTQQATAVIERQLATGAYRLEQRNGHYHWVAPKGAGFPDSDEEPGASTRLKVFVKLLGPFAPDAML